MKVVGLLVQKVPLRILKLHAKVIFALKSILTFFTDCSLSCTTCSESAIAVLVVLEEILFFITKHVWNNALRTVIYLMTTLVLVQLILKR